MMKIADALEWAVTQFSDTDTPELDAACLLALVLQQTRAYLMAWPEKTISPKQWNDFKILVARHATGEPIAYLTGEKDFWSLTLKVTPATLIPRPDTETLVEFVLNQFSLAPQVMLDLGTGSGAIALALASERPEWTVWASDISDEALAIAKENAKTHQLRNVKFHHGAFFEKLPKAHFHIICSNPPYLASHDPHLKTSIQFEPQTALVSGPSGLECLEKIVEDAIEYLQPGGWLMLEHGYDQAQAVHALLAKHDYIDIQQVKDLSGIIRLTAGRRLAGNEAFPSC